MADHDEIDESLGFIPRPIWDPFVWQAIDQNDKAKVAEVAVIKLDLIHATLTAQVKAVEALKGALSP